MLTITIATFGALGIVLLIVEMSTQLLKEFGGNKSETGLESDGPASSQAFGEESSASSGANTAGHSAGYTHEHHSAPGVGGHHDGGFGHGGDFGGGFGGGHGH